LILSFSASYLKRHAWSAQPRGCIEEPFSTTNATIETPQNDEIILSTAMQQLRDPGVFIVVHGSHGKPKTVRLQRTEAAITWRTETRRKGAKTKLGKLHQVPLAHVMYVDAGKQTTALRRVENASVNENLCFSLSLTKEGSLDLVEAK
jgi:hypothetical protein